MAVRVGYREFLSDLPGSPATYANPELPTVRDKDQADAFRHAWQKLIDYQLIEWGRDSDQFDDEGV